MFFDVYGCQMNEGDAEVVHSVLTKGSLTFDVHIGKGYPSPK